MSILLTGIAQVATQDAELGELADAALVLDGETIVWVGSAGQAPAADERVDLEGRSVLPGFVDSHAHLVFAGDRTQEFNARMSGSPYSAGGIRTTVEATRDATDAALRANVARLTGELLAAGVTTFECKSGYGLDVETEARSLRVAAEFTDETTYLGAHVVPPGIGRDEYVRLVCGEMLDACAPLARWVDVFCERGAFDAGETRSILRAGIERGLMARVHANQLSEGAGVQVAVDLGAASADHCTHLSDADVAALAGSTTVATLLPLAEFSTRSSYPDARRLLDAGVSVALATDCNPGSAYSTSMPLAIALAVREMKMTPAEAVRAATAGGAQALRRDDIGVIAVGRRADLLVLDAPSYVHLAYRPGVPLVAQVWRGGRLAHQVH
ncbi:imidazolonepropionase [Jatrophihabitans sp. GAS493]|uniref:imidazolonepropionase n=1 Tax=Jatrophihabitans sp. GAS493 TaxID=1907575 RepID=UPI000BB8061E|nr:imidazolonepropionase [Jatrophihabitans sp. GAS493]SOD71105.1 imidazolonepropionase [Jatrophihabitans sp. GAS493]